MDQRAIWRGLSCVALALAFLGPSIEAALISGGGGLLEQDDADQIELWLDEGTVKFTNLFTKHPGNSVFDFHAAVDGKARTITLIEILGGRAFEESDSSAGLTEIHKQVIGGYNPSSWHSGSGWSVTLSHVDRTAFLFNLSTGEIQNQLLDGDGLVTPGAYQTWNGAGPIFGRGHDIVLDSNLSYGNFYSYSYGGTFDSIVASPDDGIYVSLIDGGLDFARVDRLETYAVTAVDPSAVPEPASLALFGIGGVGLLATRRRRARRTVGSAR